MNTPVLTASAFAALGGPNLVYVREIKAAEILDVIDDDVELEPDQTLYAVHAADGARLAVLTDRDAAFAAASAHDLQPVAVH